MSEQKKARKAAENLGFSMRKLNLAANDFNGLSLVACPLRAHGGLKTAREHMLAETLWLALRVRPSAR